MNSFIEYVQVTTIRLEILKPLTAEQIKQVKRQKLYIHDLPEDVVNFDGEDEFDQHRKNIKVVIDGVLR